MDAINLIYIAIAALVVCLIVTLLLLVVYSGMFHSFDVGAGPPPIGQVTVAYKFTRGQYKDSGHLYTETLALAPDQRTIGVYYDSPREVDPDKMRYVVGSILAEGQEIIDEALKKKMIDEGYSIIKFPAVTNVVKTNFPHRCTLSIYIAVFRVYPRLGAYIEDHKLCAHPMIEIYDGTNIYFMAPLSKQEEFRVPELITPPTDHSIASDDTGTDGEFSRLDVDDSVES